MLPKALVELINALEELPGVGPRTAERYAYFLFKAHPAASDNLASAIVRLKESIKVCPVTYELIDSTQDISPIYSDNKRDKTLLAVVEDSFDVIALENTKSFNGTYHVLGGLISPIDNMTPEILHIPELVKRVNSDKVKEVIIATNASIEGESTAHYIQKQLEGSGVKVSRLAQGLPIGLDIEYADQITLSRALEGRRTI
ncbi:MAG TPA: recombination mediator RecR [Candidatus Saccharimonadales bacterium]|nr:recombination mediator RecR [Candidatus Saccharimonadales bacterium]